MTSYELKGWQVILTLAFNSINKQDKQVRYSKDNSAVSMYKASDNNCLKIPNTALNRFRTISE